MSMHSERVQSTAAIAAAAGATVGPPQPPPGSASSSSPLQQQTPPLRRPVTRNMSMPALNLARPTRAPVLVQGLAQPQHVHDSEHDAVAAAATPLRGNSSNSYSNSISNSYHTPVENNVSGGAFVPHAPPCSERKDVVSPRVPHGSAAVTSTTGNATGLLPACAPPPSFTALHWSNSCNSHVSIQVQQQQQQQPYGGSMASNNNYSNNNGGGGGSSSAHAGMRGVTSSLRQPLSTLLPPRRHTNTAAPAAIAVTTPLLAPPQQQAAPALSLLSSSPYMSSGSRVGAGGSGNRMRSLSTQLSHGYAPHVPLQRHSTSSHSRLQLQPVTTQASSSQQQSQQQPQRQQQQLLVQTSSIAAEQDDADDVDDNDNVATPTNATATVTAEATRMMQLHVYCAHDQSSFVCDVPRNITYDRLKRVLTRRCRLAADASLALYVGVTGAATVTSPSSGPADAQQQQQAAMTRLRRNSMTLLARAAEQNGFVHVSAVALVDVRDSNDAENNNVSGGGGGERSAAAATASTSSAAATALSAALAMYNNSRSQDESYERPTSPPLYGARPPAQRRTAPATAHAPAAATTAVASSNEHVEVQRGVRTSSSQHGGVGGVRTSRRRTSSGAAAVRRSSSSTAGSRGGSDSVVWVAVPGVDPQPQQQSQQQQAAAALPQRSSRRRHSHQRSSRSGNFSSSASRLAWAKVTAGGGSLPCVDDVDMVNGIDSSSEDDCPHGDKDGDKSHRELLLLSTPSLAPPAHAHRSDGVSSATTTTTGAEARATRKHATTTVGHTPRRRNTSHHTPRGTRARHVATSQQCSTMSLTQDDTTLPSHTSDVQNNDSSASAMASAAAAGVAGAAAMLVAVGAGANDDDDDTRVDLVDVNEAGRRVDEALQLEHAEALMTPMPTMQLMRFRTTARARHTSADANEQSKTSMSTGGDGGGSASKPTATTMTAEDAVGNGSHGRQRLPSRRQRQTQPQTTTAATAQHEGGVAAESQAEHAASTATATAWPQHDSHELRLQRALDALQRNVIAWRRVRVIGKGSFAIVYEGVLEDGQHVAVKVLEVPNLTDDVLEAVAMLRAQKSSDEVAGEVAGRSASVCSLYDPSSNLVVEVQRLVREIKLMHRLQHANIVRYIHCQVSRSWADVPGGNAAAALQKSVDASAGMAAAAANGGGGRGGGGGGAQPWLASSEGTSDALSSSMETSAMGQLLQVEIMMELCTRGPLSRLVRSSPNGRLPMPQVRRYIAQVLQGLSYLHHRGVIHRDIKIDNVLLSDEDVAKLADFGCSRRIAPAEGGSSVRPSRVRSPSHAGHKSRHNNNNNDDDDDEDDRRLQQTETSVALSRIDSGLMGTISGVAHTLVGTPLYMAPEVLLQETTTTTATAACDASSSNLTTASSSEATCSGSGGGGYSRPADVWSVGCLTLQLLGRSPWPTKSGGGGGGAFGGLQLMMRIAQSKEPLPPGVPQRAPQPLYDFLVGCLQRDPARRATAQQLLCMPWITCPPDELEELPPDA